MRVTSQAALTASSLLLAANSAAANTVEMLVPRATMTYVACYSSSEGLTNKTSYTFQSSGWCQDRCVGNNAAVFALAGGSDCLCGEELPPSSAKVSKDKCGTPCAGWPQDMCGGKGFYSVYTTGLESDVSSVSSSTTNSGDSSSPSKTDSSGTSVTTGAGGETTVVTVSSQPENTGSASENSNTKSSHNTAAIAAGVVVGVCGAAAIAGGGFFYYRSKKQKEESGFHGATGGYYHDSGPPMSDSRFDGNFMAQRRQSNGSIDDDHDFSRRILQVTNPDR